MYEHVIYKHLHEQKQFKKIVLSTFVKRKQKICKYIKLTDYQVKFYFSL